MFGMWIAKFIFTHDCILGNRCRTFKVTLQSVNFSTYHERGHVVTSSMITMSGAAHAKSAFLKDLKKDKAVLKIEEKGDVFFLLEQAKSKAVAHHTPKILFVKPVIMTEDGWEHWEVASWEKEELSRFINAVKKEMEQFKLLKLVRIGIDNVFFPKLLPDLTAKQKDVLDLAIKEGYYATPRGTNLRALAKIAKISLATLEEHLRRAEEKLIPNLFSSTK